MQMMFAQFRIESVFYQFARSSLQLFCVMFAFLVISTNTAHATPTSYASSLQPGSIFHDCPNCPEIVIIPAGKFLMGSTKEDLERDIKMAPAREVSPLLPFIDGAADYLLMETPQHPVQIDRSFGLGKSPVTRGEFAAFVRETGYRPGGYIPIDDCILWKSHSPGANRMRGNWENPGFNQSDRDPVVCVSARDAEAYISWLNKKVQSQATPPITGKTFYRLPSEAEWEYAARAGTQTAFWWGNAIGHNNAVCREWCGSHWDYTQPAPVGSFRANAFGLYDMAGNVWQLTADCWNNSYVGTPPTDGSSWNSGDCKRRAIRGGSWETGAYQIRSATRARAGLDSRTNGQGFRVARELQ